MLPVLASIAASRPPHIAFVVADDLGWNDVGFHGSKQVRTPHIDKLAAEGIVLDRYYVQHECSPSRASFLTGRHVAHTGIQAALVAGHDKDMFGRPYGLLLEFSTMPQLLKAHFNYFTVMVGKVSLERALLELALLAPRLLLMPSGPVSGCSGISACVRPPTCPRAADSTASSGTTRA